MIFRDRIQKRIDALDTNANAVSAKVGRGRTLVAEIISGKSKDPGVAKMAEIASVLGVSVAYLIGETDDPKPSAPLRTSGRSRTVWAVRTGAGATFEIPERPALGLTLEDAEGVESGYLIPEGEARILHDRMTRGLKELADHELQASSSPASA